NDEPLHRPAEAEAAWLQLYRVRPSDLETNEALRMLREKQRGPGADGRDPKKAKVERLVEEGKDAATAFAAAQELVAEEAYRADRDAWRLFGMASAANGRWAEALQAYATDASLRKPPAAARAWLGDCLERFEKTALASEEVATHLLAGLANGWDAPIVLKT